MPSRLVRFAFVVAATFCLAASFIVPHTPASAAEPTAKTDPVLRDALSKLLNDSWEKSADGLITAERHRDRAQSVAAGDPRVDFAWALVQLRYLRYSDAEKTLNGIHQASPGYWPATQAKIHLTLLMKKYSAALTEIDRFSERVAATNAESSRAEDRREAAEFLGKLFGYLEGPAAKSVSQATVAEVRGRILDRLATGDRETFSAAFGAVNERFTQLDQETKRTQADGIAAQKDQKELDLKRLQAEQAALAGDKDSVRRQAQEALETAQTKTAALDQQIAPLDAAFARVAARAQLVRVEIGRLDATAATLLSQLDVVKDPGLRAAILRDVDLITVQIRNEQFLLQNIEAEGAQINAQRGALLQQRAGVVEIYQAEAKRLGVDAAKIGRTEKRNVVQQKEAIKPPNGFTPQVQSKATTAASITSYVEFPLEREKLRLLDSLR